MDAASCHPGRPLGTFLLQHVCGVHERDGRQSKWSVSGYTPVFVLCSSACLTAQRLWVVSGRAAFTLVDADIWYVVLNGSGWASPSQLPRRIRRAADGARCSRLRHREGAAVAWRLFLITYVALYGLFCVTMIVLVPWFPNECFLGIVIAAAVCSVFCSVTFLLGSSKLSAIVAGPPRWSSAAPTWTPATARSSPRHRGRLERPQPLTRAALTRLTSDSRMKRLSLGVSAEMKRSSLGKSHLSAEELARLEGWSSYSGTLTAARRIAFGTALAVVADILFLVRVPRRPSRAEPWPLRTRPRTTPSPIHASRLPRSRDLPPPVARLTMLRRRPVGRLLTCPRSAG